MSIFLRGTATTNRPNRLGLHCVIWAAGLACLSGCWTGEAPEPVGTKATAGRDIDANRFRLARPEPPGGTYVGSAKCVACHAEISKRYQTHPMGHASALVSEAKVVEDYHDQAEFSAANRLHYRVERGEEGVFHHEQMKDRDGETIFQRSVPVQIEIGSGKRGRSYATQRGDLLFMSPISWYSQGRRWDLSPGYAHSDRPRFERRLRDECLHCHIGQLAHDTGRPNRFRSPAVLEGPISCERCHGPGAAHVAYHEAAGEGRGADTIVNPATLPPAERDAVCHQCHLQGNARYRRFGRSEYDFRPGMKFSDVWTVFVDSTTIDEAGSTKAVSQVEQMQASKCYQASDGRLGCISCHDPHGQPAEAERDMVYRQRCLACHQEGVGCAAPAEQRTAKDDSCITCHMPRLAANDVPHTSQTNHYILRHTRVVGTVASQPGSSERLFGDAEDDLPRVDRERARGLLLVGQAQQENDPFRAYEALNLLLPIMEANPSDLVVKEAVGDGYLVQGHQREAMRLWQTLLKADPENESILEKLGSLCHDLGYPEDALDYLDRWIAINPWRERAFGRKAHILAQMGRLPSAIRAGERCLELNPAAVSVQRWMAQAYQSAGDEAKSAYHRELAERIEAK